MNLHKLFATAIITAVIGLQVWMVFPPGGADRLWHWPFMNYQMYTTPHYLGEAIRRHQLHVDACSTGAPSRLVQWDDVRVKSFIYRGMLRRVAMVAAPRPDPPKRPTREIPPAEADSLVDELSRLIRTQLPGFYCRARLLEQLLIVGPNGVRDFNQPWEPVREWSVASSAGSRGS